MLSKKLVVVSLVNECSCQTTFIMRFQLPVALLSACLFGSVAAGGVSYSSAGEKRRCTVTPNGGTKDDVPNILKAFKECGNGGVVVFPEGQDYYIATRLNPVLNECEIQWHGQWTVCPFVTSGPES